MSASSSFILQQIDKYTVVEFREPSLMDPIVLEHVTTSLYHLVDVEDRRLIVLDFERVQFLSSQAIGIVINLKKKIDALGKGQLVLCGIGPRLMELLKITRLDRILTIKPSQKEAVRVVPKYA